MTSTYQEHLIKPGRIVGNSTRQVSFAIETLFTEKEVLVQDHYENGENIAANRFLLERILKRIETEHCYSTKPQFRFEEQEKFTIIKLL